MVRREGKARKAEQVSRRAEPCCTFLAGASPAQVTAGGPGSRRRRQEETPAAKRRVESLEGGGGEGAGRNKVNAEQASSDFQPKGDWECRAGHVAAKAKHSTRSNPARVLGLSGVLAAARSERRVWNTRGPTWQPTSGKDWTYKARAESGQSQEGVREARSTDEGGDKPLEGRGLTWVRPGLRVSARACP